MCAVMADRTREVGTLRALGFSRTAVSVAFLLEGFFLALGGGALGCMMSLLLNGLTTSSTGANMSEIVFKFRVSPIDLVYGLLFAVTMGVLGSVLPTLRAARLSITAALRET